MDLRPQGSLRDIVFTLFKFRWSALSIVFFALLIALFYVLIIRDTLYDATAKLMVRIGHEQAPPQSITGQMPMVMGYRYQDVNTEIDILTSADLLGQIVDKFGLDKPTPPKPPPPGLFARTRYEVKAAVRTVRDWIDIGLLAIGLRDPLSQREKAIATLQSGLLVTPQKDSNVLVAHLLLPAREGTAVVLNAIIDEYLDFRLRLYRNDKSEKFFQRAHVDAEIALKDTEARLRQFEAGNDIRILKRQEELLLEQITEAERFLREAAYKRDQAADKVKRLEHELQQAEPDVAIFGVFDEASLSQRLVQELTDLQKEREQLRLTDLDSSPRISNNRARFRTLLGMVASNLRSTAREMEESLQARLRARNQLSERLEKLHNLEMEWEALTRKRRLDEETFLIARKKHQDSATESALDASSVGNVSVIERAIDPMKPVGMRKSTMLGLALVLAIFSALAWVSLAEFFDHGIYQADFLERMTGAPTFATLPRLTRKKRMLESE
jgi:uncharacterized protein involved in exopolysaccharide biosynthesis